MDNCHGAKGGPGQGEDYTRLRLEGGVTVADGSGTNAPRAPRLPAAGWLPDPSVIALERYWDGTRWTGRVRDRHTKIEVTSGADRAAGQRYATGRRSRRRLVAGSIMGLLVAYLVAGAAGVIPPNTTAQAQWAKVEQLWLLTQPKGPDVQYPVFGSDGLVEYLARSMIAQEEAIDVTFWMLPGRDYTTAIQDAMYEAVNQNPYVFTSRWLITDSQGQALVRPTYEYPAEEAERRRAATQAAVALAVEQSGASALLGAEEKATAIHDYITEIATYDHDIYAAIKRGETPETMIEVAESQEAYGILVEGTAVCNGYAQAFLLLAEAAGLEAVVVTGMTNAGVYLGAHAWNKVLIDGEWRVVDVTWDDNDGDVAGREWFLLANDDPVLRTRAADDRWMTNAYLEEYTR